jgi:hypothetical protein
MEGASADAPKMGAGGEHAQGGDSRSSVDGSISGAQSEQVGEVVTGVFSESPNEVDHMVTYAPQVFYFRRALRTARTLVDAMELGLAVVEELDSLKSWVWDRGLIPPMFRTLPEHLIERGWQNGMPANLLPEECL